MSHSCDNIPTILVMSVIKSSVTCWSRFEETNHMRWTKKPLKLKNAWQGMLRLLIGHIFDVFVDYTNVKNQPCLFYNLQLVKMWCGWKTICYIHPQRVSLDQNNNPRHFNVQIISPNWNQMLYDIWIPFLLERPLVWNTVSNNYKQHANIYISAS